MAAESKANKLKSCFAFSPFCGTILTIQIWILSNISKFLWQFSAIVSLLHLSSLYDDLLFFPALPPFVSSVTFLFHFVAFIFASRDVTYLDVALIETHSIANLYDDDDATVVVKVQKENFPEF